MRLSIKDLGKLAGGMAGKVIGGAVRVVGEFTNSSYIKEIGDSTEKATTKTGELAGALVGSAWDIGSGLVNQNEQKVDRGKHELSQSVKTTVQGIGQGLGYVAENGKDIVQGVQKGDNDRAKRAALNLGKVAAVSVLAVGIFDVLDGVDAADAAADIESSDMVELDDGDIQDLDEDYGQNYLLQDDVLDPYSESVHTLESPDYEETAHISTINEGLEGSVHPETGVPYDAQTIEMPDGETIEGVFPDFTAVYSDEIPQELYLESDFEQFAYLNNELAADIEADPSLAAQFDSNQLAQILSGETPDGYVWHHTEIPGQMELVDEEIHARSGHTGGRALWGGGETNR